MPIDPDKIKDVEFAEEASSPSPNNNRWISNLTSCRFFQAICGAWLKTKHTYLSIRSFLFATDKIPPEAAVDTTDLKQSIRAPIRFALIAIGVAFLLFVVWGGIAPLDSAVVAPGSIVLNDNRKVIQHKEGGIIEAIKVKDGDHVVEGQPLVILSDMASRAKVQQILSQLRTLRAVEIRLLAEQNNAAEVVFNDAILDPTMPEVQQVISTQHLLFKAKMQLIKGQMDAYRNKIAQHQESINAAQTALKALRANHSLVQEELHDMQSFFSEGYARKTELFALKKQNEELTSKIAEVQARIAQDQSAIAMTKLESLNVMYRHHEAVNAELKEVGARVLTLQEEYRAEKEVLHRTIVRAPNTGIVTHIKYHTLGGVVHAGAPLLEIIPQDDALIVEAQVMPKDIESVRIGLPVRVQLSAYKTRLVPRVEGKVIYVSADKVNDERVPAYQQHYIARVRLNPEELKRINHDIALTPGMPAEVFIVKGERTFLEYMLSPILDSFHKAFKEA